MTFKDASNAKCNQTGAVAADGTPNVVHLSNLCTEILEVTNQAETAVCNLGSVNLGAMVRPDASGALAFDFDRLAEVVRLAVPFLDRVVDINFYPTDEAGNSNAKWRPVGPGPHGPAGRVLQAAPAVRLRRGARAVDAHLRGDLLPRADRLDRAGRAARPPRRLGRDPGRQGRAAVRPVGRHPVGPGPLGRAQGADRPSTGCATRC